MTSGLTQAPTSTKSLLILLLTLYPRNAYIILVAISVLVVALSNISPPREKLCIGATVSTKMGAKQVHVTGQARPLLSNEVNKIG